jgi:hypothetical protein
MTGFNLIELDDMIEELGEDRVKSILFNFTCPMNKDVEHFLKEKAILFSTQGLAKTHLVFMSYKGNPELVGYFSLANKFIMLKEKALSNTLEKRVRKFANHNRELKTYFITAPLIAQFGKNHTIDRGKLITGDELLKLACDKIAKVQSVIGGKIVYLECEDIEALIEFYSRNGFVNFGKRPLDPDETNLKGEFLVQMLKYI